MTTTTATQKITLINMSNGDVRAHAAECRDIARETSSRTHNEICYTAEFASLAEMRADYNSDFDADTDGWYAIDSAPCVHIN